MDREADEEDYRRDAYDERERCASSRCECHFEMPGTCPGPAYCPMCDTDDV